MTMRTPAYTIIILCRSLKSITNPFRIQIYITINASSRKRETTSIQKRRLPISNIKKFISDFEKTVNTDDVVLLSLLLTGEDLPLPNTPTQNKLGDLL